jgi:hypothetical protein
MHSEGTATTKGPASGNLSRIWDVAVWPLWHPAPPEGSGKPRAVAAALKERVLFSDAADAMRFLDAYRSEPWAEDEADTPFEGHSARQG